jgi:hypothetical protein
LGRVKTRLAHDLGEEMALKVYRKLVDNTLHHIQNIPADKWILFTDFQDEKIVPDGLSASTGLQKGKDLGERMHQAFLDGFRAGYQRVCLIGGDCFEITAAIINEAFDRLHDYDFVLGPANDGGYYLIGMSHLLDRLFRNKKWGTSSVLKNTLSDIKKETSTYYLLRELVDVDTIDDFDHLNIKPENFIQNEP